MTRNKKIELRKSIQGQQDPEKQTSPRTEDKNVERHWNSSTKRRKPWLFIILSVATLAVSIGTLIVLVLQHIKKYG